MTDLIWSSDGWQPANDWPVADRALQYGDGLFETLRLTSQGEVPLWAQHRQRLLHGLVALDFPIDSWATVERAWKALPHGSRQTGAGKLLVSRGSGPRGYAPPVEPQLNLLWQAFQPADWAHQRHPHGVRADFSDVLLSRQPLLAGFKHLNRLEQVLARGRFPADCQEVVMCDTDGQVIEGCMSNLFILQNGRWRTPALTHSGVNGVVRRWLLEQMQADEVLLTPQDLLQADVLFFCNTLNGIMPVHTLASRRYDPLHPGWKQALKWQHRLETLFC